MLAREHHATRDAAEQAAWEHSDQSGGEDVWILGNGLYTSWPLSLRDLMRRIDPEAVMLIGAIGAPWNRSREQAGR